MSEMVRRKELLAKTGMSASTQWREEKAGRFPARVQISAGIVAWLKSDVEMWFANRQAVTPATVKAVAPLSRRGRKPKSAIAKGRL